MADRQGGAALDPGLYVVSTPIGAARDITLRALDVLAQADAIAAEDTRTTRKLLDIHGISLSGRPLIPYHDHNGPEQRPRILAMIAAGQSVAYVSDAGTPLVADPGFVLAREAAEAGFRVRAAPGPSAILAALVVSGLPSDRFLFAGFLPPGAAARERVLRELAPVPATLIFFETARRSLESLQSLATVFGETRQGALCRELTKKFEEIRRGSLAELAQSVRVDPPKGEIVFLVDRDRAGVGAAERDAMLKEALKTMSVKDAARHVSDCLSLPRREVYQAALAMGAGT
ncbi:MAG: 16S rRNA (cytidine(1402)-2'-O)-methyltransferase [Pseudomonadota bacterium]